MIIKSEWENPVIDTKLYHQEGPHADADHQLLTALAAFIASLQEILNANTHHKVQTILWSIRRCLNKIPTFIIHL
jgi:hypothetical protein